MLPDALSIVLALLLPATPAQQRPVEQTLDVMWIAPATAEMEQEAAKEKHGCGCVSGNSSPEPPRARVKMTLVYVSPLSFAVGDTVVFELLLEHVGKEAIPLAISRNPTLAPSCRGADGDVRTSFALFPRGSNHIITSGPHLYGERGAAATTMMLNPWERLRVRAPATISGMDPTHAAIGESQALDVEGAILTNWDRCRAIVERSQGTLPVVVSRPKQTQLFCPLRPATQASIETRACSLPLAGSAYRRAQQDSRRPFSACPLQMISRSRL